MSIIFCSVIFDAYAQRDSLLLNNGDVIVGEVKEMERGILTIETDYSDSDFKIEWEKIEKIYTESYFLITLMDGRRLNGSISSTDSAIVNIVIDDGIENTHNDSIVFLKSVDPGFWSKLYASVDLGFSHTKASDLRQYNIRSNIGYLADRWMADASYNHVQSSQNDVQNVRRVDAGFTYRFLLPKDYFLLAQIAWLSNTEQNLALRTNSKLGVGRYLIRTNRTYLGVQGGVSFNNEDFSSETSSRKSGEGFAGAELNMYDVGDLSLLSNIVVYPSFTESGRWRVDYTFDFKYDLPLDFYVKLGVTLNYDNQPIDNTSTTDYVVQTSFGWEL